MSIRVLFSAFAKTISGLLFLGLMVFSLCAHSESTIKSHVVLSMPANSWLEIPNSRLDSVGADSEEFPDVQAYGGVAGILAYSGAIFDTKRNRLVVWGGGHADYYGNELYAFDTDTLTWERLTDPSDPNLNKQVNHDGTPNSRHTYNGIDYIEHADRLFGTGGTLANPGGGCGADITWVFDFDTKQWLNMNPATTPETYCENLCAYDPHSKKVWWFDYPGLWSYDYDSNTWEQHNQDYLYRRTAAVDTKRGLLLVVGQNQVVAYDIRNGDYAQQIWETTGGEPLISKPAPGLAYDPVSDRLVGWGGGSVYALNMETKVWTEHNAPGVPDYNRSEIEGLNGAWRYVPDLNAFIVITSTSKNIHFYKLSAGPG